MINHKIKRLSKETILDGPLFSQAQVKHVRLKNKYLVFWYQHKNQIYLSFGLILAILFAISGIKEKSIMYATMSVLSVISCLGGATYLEY